MTSPLLVVGSVAFDCIQTRAGKRDEILGGAATYISLAASPFTPVNLVGVVGENDFPDENVQLLTDHGVDVSGLERVEGKTFRWSGVYADDFSSRKTLDTQLGVFEFFDPKIPQDWARCPFLMLGNINPGLQLKVLDAVKGDCFVAMDTMNLWIDITPDELNEVIMRVDLLIINDEESFLLTGEPQVSVAAEKIMKNGPEALIIKRGEHGAWLFSRDTPFFAPAFPLREVVDPTGAGDSFAGGLMGYLARVGSSNTDAIKKGMIYGTATAAATCQGFGVEMTAKLTLDVVEEQYASLRKIVSTD